MYYTGASPGFWFGGEGTSDKISYMNSPQVLYCTIIQCTPVMLPEFPVGDTFNKDFLNKDFRKFLKNL